MQYIPTDLPQYWKLKQRSQFSSALIRPGHVLLFSQDGQSLTAKLPDGSFVNVGGSDSIVSKEADVILGVVNADGKFQPFKFEGTQASNSGAPIAVSQYKTWNSTLPSPTPTPSGGMDELEFFDWYTILT